MTRYDFTVPGLGAVTIEGTKPFEIVPGSRGSWNVRDATGAITNPRLNGETATTQLPSRTSPSVLNALIATVNSATASLPDAAVRATINDVLVSSGINEVLANRSIINIDAFGADEDFATAIELAVAKAATVGGTVVGTAGKVYYSRRRVEFTDTPVRIDLSMSIVERAEDFSTHEKASEGNPFSAAPVLRVSYSHGPVLPATGALSIVGVDLGFDGGTNSQVTRIPLADTSSFQPGDYVHIAADNPIPWGTGTDHEYLGQSARIAYVNANSIDLFNVAKLHPYLLTNVRVAKKTALPCEISINGRDPASFYANPNTDIRRRRNAAFVEVIGAISPRFPNMRCRRLMAEFLATYACYDPVVDILDVADIRTSTTYYAYGYGWVTADTYPTLLRPMNGFRTRHVFTTRARGMSALTNYLSNGGAYPSYPIHYWGGVVSGYVHGGNLIGCNHSPYDTHADAIDVTFDAPRVRSMFKGPNSWFYGVQLRGTQHKVINLDTDGIGCVKIAPTGVCGGFKISGKHRRQIGHQFLSNACFIVDDGGSATRPDIHLDLEVDCEDAATGLFEFNNCVVTGKLRCSWAFAGASSSRVIRGNKYTARNLEVDADLSSGTGTQPRLATVNTADTSVHIRRANVRLPKGGTLAVGDFYSTDGGSIVVDELHLEGGNVGNTNGGFSNPGASSVYRVNVIKQDTADHATTDTGTTWSTTGTKTISSLNGRHEPIITMRAVATAAGVILNAGTLPAGTRPGQLLIIENSRTAASGTPVAFDITATYTDTPSNVTVTKTIPRMGAVTLRWDGANAQWRIIN